LQGPFEPTIEALSLEVGARTRSALIAAGLAVSEAAYDIHMREQAVRGQELVRQIIVPVLSDDDGVGARFKAQLPFIAAAGYDLGFGIHAFAYHHYGRAQDVGRLCSLLNVGISVFDHVCDSGLSASLVPFFGEDTLRRLIDKPEEVRESDFEIVTQPRVRFLLSLVRAFFADLHSSSTARPDSDDWAELRQMLIDAHEAEIASVTHARTGIDAEALLRMAERKSVLPFEMMLAIARICESDSGDIEETEARSLSQHIGKVFALSDDLFDLGRDLQSGDANTILLEAGVANSSMRNPEDAPDIIRCLLDNGHVDRAVRGLCANLAAAVALIDENDDATGETYRLRERILCYVRSWTAIENPGRPDRPDSTILTENEADACLKLARAALCGGDAVAGAPATLPDVAFEMVNLTVYSAGRLRASVSGHGLALADAIQDASRKALKDERFGAAITPEDVHDGRLELWVQHGSTLVMTPHEIDLGLDGVMFSAGAMGAYYKPSVALTSAITRPEDLLDKLAKKAGLDAKSWKADDARVWRTTWQHYVERGDAGEKPLRLRRMRPIDAPPVTPTAVRNSATLAAKRLIHVQQPSGLFQYEVHPFRRAHKDGPTSYVRQAGCAFAMARAAERFTDPTIAEACLHSARRAIDVLLESSVVLANGRYLVEPGTGQGKLGVTALTLAALQCAGLCGAYPHQRRQLGAAIMFLQREDGSFRCTNGDGPAEADGHAQDFFPGESLMALCRELNDGSPQVESVIRKAFPWYQDYFRRHPTTAFVPWQADAWRLFAEFSDDETEQGAAGRSKYESFVFEIVDWILQFQRDDDACSDEMTGGFSISGSAPGSATACYAEAVVRAYGLASRLGATEHMERYRRAAKLAIGFIFRLQISPETAFLFDDPDGTVGGTTKSLRDMTIRCDFDQHAITACLAALETPGLLDVTD
jgi:AMMECR1 domain-containing protein